LLNVGFKNLPKDAHKPVFSLGASNPAASGRPCAGIVFTMFALSKATPIGRENVPCSITPASKIGISFFMTVFRFLLG